MSKIVLYPANGYDFDAADVAAYLAGLTSGVFSSAEDFPVTAAGGLKVTVGAGRGWVHPSRFTGYSITKREADTLTMPLADPSLPRIDCIVMRYDAGARAASLQVLQGTASSTPTAPAISRTELIYDLCLAEITRPAGSTNITTGQITDTRLDEALCGIVRDGVTGIPTEELIASARERINALEETASAAAKQADASKTAAAQSEANAEAYKEAAATSEHNAAGSASASSGSAAAAARSEGAAAGSATEAAGSASAAEKSKTAAATSESNAAKHEEAAKKAADEAGAKAGTDKTLSIENAPADAKATGDALAKKVGKDVILDEDGNVIFYSKAAVDELLAGKLGLHDTADNSKKLDGYELRLSDHPGSANILVQTVDEDGRTCIDCRNAASIGLTAFAASGVNYVRFNEGTQICWDRVAPANVITSTEKYVSFPVPFAGNAKVLTCSNANMGGTPVQVGWESTTGFTIGGGWNNIGAGSGETSWIAIGRWK